MITIISGTLNEGKTTALLKLSSELKAGTYEGFACVKRYSPNGVWKGYDLIRLSDHDRIEALTFKDFYHEGYAESFEHGPFVFSQAMFEAAEAVYEKALADPKITTLLMDEVGQVELNGKGYDRILKKILDSDKDLILTVKTDLLDAVLNHYGIIEKHPFRIITPT